MTTIYLMNHSKAKMEKEYIHTNESLQLENEKFILSVEGETLAQHYSKIKQLKKIDIIYSSNYVRSMSTAKYICDVNNKPLYIDESFGERKFGVNNWNEIPNDFFDNQILDENYKLGNGESKKEVKNRMLTSLRKVLKQNKNQTILIVSHSSSIAFLLDEWCDISYDSGYVIYYGNKSIVDGLNSPDLIKLTFDDDKLKDIEHVN